MVIRGTKGESISIKAGDRMEWDPKAHCIIIVREGEKLLWHPPRHDDAGDKRNCHDLIESRHDFSLFADLVSRMLGLGCHDLLMSSPQNPTFEFYRVL